MPVSLRKAVMAENGLDQDLGILVSRSQLLGREDQMLFSAVVFHNQPATHVAKLLGKRPRTLAGRVKRLGRRLASAKFIMAARLLSRLPHKEAQLVRLWYCECQTQRDICRQLGLSMHQVRRTLDRLDGELRTLCRRGRAKPAPNGEFISPRRPSPSGQRESKRWRPAASSDHQPPRAAGQ